MRVLKFYNLKFFKLCKYNIRILDELFLKDKQMKKISLRWFLVIFFIFLTSVVSVLIVSIVFKVNSSNKSRAFKSEFRDAHYLWTKAQHAQHDFFIKYKDDLIFFQTEQSKYIKRSQINIANTKNKVDSLIEFSYSNEYGLEDELQQFNNKLVLIENVFEQISHLLFLRGSQKTGIIGNSFTLYDLSINSVTDEQLRKLLINSQTSFLNYLNDPNFTYYEDFLNVFTIMNSYIRQQNVVRDTGVIDTLQLLPQNSSYSPEFIGYVNDYKQSFSKLVSIDKKIFLNDQANLMSQWTTLNHEFGEIFSTNVKEINKKTEITVDSVQTTMVISLLITLLVLIIVNIIMPRIVSRRVRELQDFIEPLKTGKIPEDSFVPKAFTEVIEISESMEQVVKLLKNASAFAEEIGKGNFNFEFAPIGEQDNLGNALILLRDNLAKAQKDEIVRRQEDNIREWTNTGIAKFSDILRQTAKDISELSIVIIKELVNYLEANQGGVFVLNDNDRNNLFLELSASYAYSKERKKKKSFVLGEGLIGTCAVEKATIYMTEIPEDYISITSGLGASNPRSLLIVPLKHEDTVLGVIEIASFNKFEKHQIEFVEKIAESIASTISVTKINERTAKLLESAKLETEQRSLKEEELKQNLEELQATQERAMHRETELNNLISLVNKVAYIFELDIEGNIISVPDSIKEKFGIDNSMIIGHHFSEFDISKDSVLKDDVFWQNLLNGEEQHYLREFENNQESFWFNDYMVSFKDINGEIKKIICVAFDVTKQINEKDKFQDLTNDLQEKEKEILQKIKDIEKVKQNVELEKAEAIELSQKLEASENVLKKTLNRNKIQLEKIENAVKNAEIQSQRFQMLFDSSSDAIQLLSEGKFTDCNPATLEMFGYTKEEFLKVSPSDISPTHQKDGVNSGEKANEMMKLAVQNGTHKFEWMHQRADGTDFPCEVILVAFKIEGIQFLYALIKDVSYKNSLKNELSDALRLEKEAKQKYQVRSREFRAKLEKFDIELEQKEAEIYRLKKMLGIKNS